MRLYGQLLVFAVLVAGCSTTPTRQVSGSQTFEAHCAACHGVRGDGDGPVVTTLRAQPPSLRTLAARNGGEFPADRIASYIDGRALPAAHGARAMPVWGSVFGATEDLIEGAESSDERIEAVIAYLRELQDP